MTEVDAGRPSVDVAVEEVIHRPLDVVAGDASDPSNTPDWYANISKVEWKTRAATDGGNQGGLRRPLPRANAAPHLRDRRAHADLPRDADGGEALPDGDQLPLHPHGRRPHPHDPLQPRRAHRVGRAVSPFIRMAMRRANRKDLQALKLRLEG